MPSIGDKHLEGNVTSKGQVTIPAEFRRRMGITKGTKIRFDLDKDGVLELHVVKTDETDDKEELIDTVEALLDRYHVAMDYLRDK